MRINSDRKIEVAFADAGRAPRRRLVIPSSPISLFGRRRLSINLKAAKALGPTFPLTLLSRPEK
jgi:hypothetical protein